MYKKFWRELDAKQKQDLAEEAGTTASYLRHVMHGRKDAGPKLALRLHTATGGVVNKSVLRPDIYPPSDVAA
ncbi:hypothetical protein BZJ19_10135 [Salinivibrio proteolyticus]|uniref:YdaS family helix-turn-helix protein n=1 Tax=Salinivibrio proteolyticus TaxID=334715 RepID=UPI0009897FD4|nr:YdaS family helix-turn-helix protein [Salinivibrio proteolyticus]OOF25068.1 hypothetical protein BZJ19_10135 [Salinivibrio proteolyticus]